MPEFPETAPDPSCRAVKVRSMDALFPDFVFSLLSSLSVQESSSMTGSSAPTPAAPTRVGSEALSEFYSKDSDSGSETSESSSEDDDDSSEYETDSDEERFVVVLDLCSYVYSLGLRCAVPMTILVLSHPVQVMRPQTDHLHGAQSSGRAT